MKSILSLYALLLSAIPLSAHETWLQAPAASAIPGAEITLQLTSAHGFKGAGTGPKPERVNKSTLRIGGETLPLTTGERTDKFLSFTGTPNAAGIAVFAVELKPREIELNPAQVEEYFGELKAGPDLRAAWENVPAPRRWRERFVKSATTFVLLGTPDSPDLSWQQPAGLSLEIVPQLDPTTLKTGDTLKVQLLKHGKPLAGLQLGFVSDGEAQRHTIMTDANGFAEAPVDHPGRWLVHGTHLVRTTQTDLEWESLFSTLVVNVAPSK